jgi:hypothetical protein
LIAKKELLLNRPANGRFSLGYLNECPLVCKISTLAHKKIGTGEGLIVAFDSAGWIKRATQIVSKGDSAHYNVATEATQFATSMLTAVYGEKSTQLKAFAEGCGAISKLKVAVPIHLCRHAYGAINNAKAELEAGLIGTLRLRVTGEVLADLVGMGKDILAEGTDAAKNVAAVMIAAAFEDLMRRMGFELAGVAGRPSLQDVLTALKAAGVLKGGEIGTAQSFLKFRNDSLHADWANVSRAQIESCTAFIEAMLVNRLS